MVLIEIPNEYAWTLLSATALPFVTSFVMGGSVMKARSTFNVPLPNRANSGFKPYTAHAAARLCMTFTESCSTRFIHSVCHAWRA